MGFEVIKVHPPGEVVEWLMALVLKTSDVKASVGSNPTLSVSETRNTEFRPRPIGFGLN